MNRGEKFNDVMVLDLTNAANNPGSLHAKSLLQENRSY